MNSTIAAVTVAGLAGLGTAAALDASSTPANQSAATVAPPHVRTEVVTQTIHRVRRVHVRRHDPATTAPPAPTAAQGVPAPATAATVPVAVRTPAPAPRPAPVRTRSSGAGSARGDDDQGEREDGHEVAHEGDDD